MIIRSVFNLLEVVIKKEQPQQKNIIEEKNIVEEEVTNKTEDKKETSTLQERQKEKEKIIHNLEPKERYDRPCRNGFNLYTVVATIKIGNDKFIVQKIIEEKNERLANIEYDRMIKKEFGKPKSVTKRNSKEYENGEKDFCMQPVEETPKVIEKTQEEIALEKKIELLQGEYMGLYKIIFNKNNFVKDTQYIFASSREDVDVQIDFILDKDKRVEDKSAIYSKIRSVTRLTTSAMKVDKGCLKRLADCTVEEIEQMVEGEKERQQKISEQAKKKYQELIEKGFKLYVGKLLPKKREIFVELARDDDEANLIILAEDRVHKAMLAGQSIEGAAVGEVEKYAKDTEAFKGFKDKDLDLNQIKTIAAKDDIIYITLFGEKTVEEYIKYVDNAKKVMDTIKNGGVDKLLQEKLQEIKTKIGKDNNLLDKILEVDKMKKNLFGSNRETLRALLNK